MRRSILIPVAALILGGFVIFWAGTTWLRMQANANDFTANTDLLQIVIGNDVLDIPANYTRIASQRESETADRLDLVMLWPDGSGYSEARAPLFTSGKHRAKRLLITLSKREMKADMTGRLDTVYQELFDGPPRETGTDLQLQRLKEGAGYAGEVLAISDDRSWVARCETDPEDDFASCMRDVHLGETLTVRYRFPRQLLDNWKEVEALVTGRINAFLQT